MSEANFWGRVRDGLRAAAEQRIDLSRVENLVEVGMPDVNFCAEGGFEGWIELKYAARAPVRDGTPNFTHGGLRDAQVLWLHKRAKRGGRCWILAQIGPAMFLVHGSKARHFNGYTYLQLIEESAWWHSGIRPDWKALLRALID